MSNALASSIVKKGLTSLLAAAALAVSVGAHGALLPRDIDGDGVVDAYYDTAQNITWLADWSASGQLTWDQAVAWAAALNVHGVTGWRLPSVTDTGNSGCDFSVAGGTDCGYNVDTKTSELARLWYVTLGNLAFCTRGDPNCDLQGAGQPGSGLTNTRPFRNMQASTYWSGTEYAPDVSEAWTFATDDGAQDSEKKTVSFYAVAVHVGDVSPAPVGYKFIDLGVGMTALGAGGGQQVGVQGNGPAPDLGVDFPPVHALLWTDSADSVVDLHPTGFLRSTALGAAGRQQVGYAVDAVGELHAMLWTGSAASATDLTADGFSGASALGTDLGHQVGWGWVGRVNPPSHALLWTGSAASVIDLHPVGFTTSSASGVGDGQQVGGGSSALDGHGHALLWTGDAASVVDLHPAGFTDSYARGVAGGQQIGSAIDKNGISHALMWTGSAGSAVDLSPAGFVSSQASAVAGGQQVGVAASATYSIFSSTAMLWTGSAQSAVNLHNFLPRPFFATSSAQGIDDAGNIAGKAAHFILSRYGFPGIQSHAILWVPVLPYGLDITETGNPNFAHPGDQITYTITVTNSRSGTGTGVRLMDTIPVGTTFVSATTDQGSCSGTVAVTCDLGALPGASSAHVTLVVQVPQGFLGQSVNNTGSVEADELITKSASVVTPVTLLPDLTGNWTSALQTCKNSRGVTTCSIVGKLKVVNQGTGGAGPSIVRFYLSDDASLSADDLLLGQINVPSVQPGASKAIRPKLSLAAGSNASGKFVIALLDANGVLSESNKSNNVVATARLP